MLLKIWKQGLAQGPPDHSPFDESIERKWVEHWLFYANSIRIASAMGGPDYGVFEGGRWRTSGNLVEMMEWLKLMTREKPEDDPR